MTMMFTFLTEQPTTEHTPYIETKSNSELNLNSRSETFVLKCGYVFCGIEHEFATIEDAEDARERHEVNTTV